jgi:hypothetical protein
MNSISAVLGLSAWLAAFDRDAAAISCTSPDTTSASPSDDFVTAMAAIPSDVIGVRAAIQVVRSQDEMLGSMLDMLA